MGPAIFLDRDGVLNVDKSYVHKVEDLEVPSGVGEGLVALKDALNPWFIVLTNQSGVARGYFTLADVDSFHDALQKRLMPFDVAIDAFYVCPHHPKGTVAQFAVKCDCRKPGIRFIQEAAQHFQIDLDSSWLIGDKDSDIECGQTAGIRTVQIDTGMYPQNSSPNFRGKSFSEAVRHILG